MDIIREAVRVLHEEAEALKRAANKINGDFTKAVEMIFNCEGHIVVVGVGKSGIIGQKIAATLASTGTPAFFIHPTEGGHGDYGMITKKEVIIAISNSGNTEELLPLLPFVKRFGIQLIAMTGNLKSKLADAADAVIDCSIEKEACPLNLAPTTSTTVTLALGDAISIALMDMRNFDEEAFAIRHPKGRLGKQLTLRVEDIMSRDTRNPVIPFNATIKDALLEMTSNKVGLCTVVDKKGILCGVFSDGDLRRCFQNMDKNGILDIQVSDVMTKNPITISRDRMAVEAERIMEEKFITAIPVVDSENRPIGMVHIHNLLQESII
ncbi:MAG: KpsF/GutQ family sugar-phosphate isomerase [Acidobacteria bacterium]|nr:KpsF/GutQ family sugar-phosphate isomerase [Acidobacteriota bacterium]